MSLSHGTIRELLCSFGVFLPWHPLAVLENEMYCSYRLLDPLGFGSEVLIVRGSLYTTVLSFTRAEADAL